MSVVTCPTCKRVMPKNGKHNCPIKEMVNGPDHYKGTEVIEFIESFSLNFSRGSAIKYISRAGLKYPHKEIEDLRKAVWYLQREITHLEKSKEDSSTRDD